MVLTRRGSGVALCAVLALSIPATEARTVVAQSGQKAPAADQAGTLVVAPADYTIGADDVLLVTVWHEPSMSGEVTVRPDGKITMPLGNDIPAAGLTTDELKLRVARELEAFYREPEVFIQVRQMNSRRVFITGAVNKPGPYAMVGPMTVLQLIATAGGLLEYADKKHIVVISGSQKGPDGQPVTRVVNYDDLARGKNIAQNNLLLQPRDQIIVR